MDYSANSVVGDTEKNQDTMKDKSEKIHETLDRMGNFVQLFSDRRKILFSIEDPNTGNITRMTVNLKSGRDAYNLMQAGVFNENGFLYITPKQKR